LHTVNPFPQFKYPELTNETPVIPAKAGTQSLSLT
jgi:hypothetical protein